MPRFASSLNSDACIAGKPSVAFADFDFPTGRVRYCDHYGDMSWGGNTWQGIGLLGDLGAIEENLEVVALPVEATLNVTQLDAALVSSVMADRYQGKAAVFYLGWLADSGALVDTPETLWAGRLDNHDFDVANMKLKVTCEYRLRKEPASARMTDEDQRQRFSGDKFFERIPLIKGARVKWGDIPTGFGGGDGRRNFLNRPFDKF